MSDSSICGCGWPLDSNAHLDRCVDLDSNSTVVAAAGSGGAVLAHGALMSVAWGLVIPIGATVPRFWRPALLQEDRWLAVHRGLQLFGAALTAAGFGVIVMITPAHLHFAEHPHRSVGLVVSALLLLQLVLGFGRPARPAEGRTVWRATHAALVLFLLVAAGYQVISGVEWSGYRSLYGVWGGGLAIAVLATVIVSRRTEAAKLVA